MRSNIPPPPHPVVFDNDDVATTIVVVIRTTALIGPDLATRYNPSFGPGGELPGLGYDLKKGKYGVEVGERTGDVVAWRRK